jgi:hypothetical protein
MKSNFFIVLLFIVSFVGCKGQKAVFNNNGITFLDNDKYIYFKIINKIGYFSIGQFEKQNDSVFRLKSEFENNIYELIKSNFDLWSLKNIDYFIGFNDLEIVYDKKNHPSSFNEFGIQKIDTSLQEQIYIEPYYNKEQELDITSDYVKGDSVFLAFKGIVYGVIYDKDYPDVGYSIYIHHINSVSVITDLVSVNVNEGEIIDKGQLVGKSILVPKNDGTESKQSIANYMLWYHGQINKISLDKFLLN